MNEQTSRRSQAGVEIVKLIDELLAALEEFYNEPSGKFKNGFL